MNKRQQQTPKIKLFDLPYGKVEVPAGILPVAVRRIAGLSGGGFHRSPQLTAMGAYLQGIEDCYAALEHTGRLKP